MHKMEVWQRFQTVDIGERGDNVELVEADNVIFGVLHRQVSGYPASTKYAVLVTYAWDIRRLSYINPAPPVIRMFFTSLRGSNRVVPIRR